VVTTSQQFTAEKLFQMPDDGFRYELVKGELKAMTPSGSKHGMIVINLTLPLAAYVKANQLGIVLGAETGFRLARDPDTVRAPDIAFVAKDQIPPTGVPETFWTGPPDLAVEVLSPADTLYDVEEKVADWLSAGTRMVWLVNPKQRTIHLHRPGSATVTLKENDQLEGQDVLPGFRCPVAEIFG
jgi:Uma2 family endonuclease